MKIDTHHALPDSIAVKIDGPIAIVSLTRAAKRNALNDPTVLGLGDFFRAPPDTIGAVVLLGEGDHFCAGLDLSELQERDAVEGMHHSRMWHEALDRISYGKVPVVAVLHGAVVGGGLELAAATHIRVAEASTFYALPEGQRGIFVGGGGSVRIPRLMGVSRMADMMLTGRTYSAEEGLQAGLSQYLVPNGEGLAKGIELAKKIAGNASMTNFAVMHALPRIADTGRDEGLLTESLMAAIAQSAPEAKARIRDFMQKRAGSKVEKK
ncbi:MAG TPA: crotonase/enoyl-CoA hydratase family protein [Magnetospirillaceae bacterium]|jgi:enoyl-CoA hydratase/carnithine racemase